MTRSLWKNDIKELGNVVKVVTKLKIEIKPLHTLFLHVLPTTNYDQIGD